MATPRARTVRNLTIFAVVVCSVGFAGGMLAWLLAPAITALTLRTFAGDGWADFGIRPRFRAHARWYVVAILIFPVVASIVIAAGAALGLVRIPDISLGAVAALTGSVLLGIGPPLAKNVFEETAWRGYLAPRVYALGMTGIGGHLLVGAIWGLWHIPYYLYFLDRATLAEFSTLAPGAFAAVATVVMMAWAIVYGELYLLTRSFWPAVLMHTVEDAFVNQLFMGRHVVIETGADWLVSPVNGVLGIIAFAAVGMALNRRRTRGARA